MKMEQIQCSETLAHKIQTPPNYPEESTQHSEHGESLKSRISIRIFVCMCRRGNNHSSNATARKTSSNSHYTMKYSAEIVSLKWSDSEIQRQRNCWKKGRNPNSKADTRVATASLLSLSHSIRDVPYSTRYTVSKILPVSLSVSHRFLIYWVALKDTEPPDNKSQRTDQREWNRPPATSKVVWTSPDEATTL